MGSSDITAAEAVRMFKAAHLAHLQSKSTMPAVELQAIVKRSPQKFTTTNGLTTAIVKYITFRGGFANRISTSGRQIKTESGKTIMIPGQTKRGTPDINVIFAGMPAIGIEVKNVTTGDRMRPDQHKVKAQIEAAGGIYFIAETFEGFISWWHSAIETGSPLSAA